MSVSAKLKRFAKSTITNKMRITGATADTAVGSGVAGAIASAVTTTTVVGSHVALNTPAVFAAFATTSATIVTAPAWLPFVTVGLVAAGSFTGLTIATKGAKKAGEWLDKL